MKTYRRDYVEINNALVPLRWMAWESIVEVFISVFEIFSCKTLLAHCIYVEYNCRTSYFQGRYTTKSDVWAFGVTLWEILNFAGVRPHAELTETEVFLFVFLYLSVTSFQCTMCILGTMFTFQPNKLRHILKVAS